MPAYFFTLSAAELQWHDQHSLFHPEWVSPGGLDYLQNMPKACPEHDEPCKDPPCAACSANFKQRAGAVRAHLGLVSAYFVCRLEFFFKYVIWMMGVAREIWGRLEFAAGRGMTHCHGLFWNSCRNNITAQGVAPHTLAFWLWTEKFTSQECKRINLTFIKFHFKLGK